MKKNENKKIFDINTLHKKSNPRNIRSSLNKDEEVALKDLSKWDDIIITNEGKCNTVVIMGLKDYIRETKRQLNGSKN